MDRSAVEARPTSTTRGEQFISHRVVDDADLDLAARDAGDRDAEMRNPAGEIRRAVDRIDDPDWRAVGPGATVRLLANETVLGEGFVEARRDQFFCLAIDLGQVVLRSLEADLEGGVDKPPARERPRL